MRKILLTVLLAGVFVFAGIFAALQVPHVSVFLIRQAMSRAMPEARLTEITIARQSVHWPGGLVFHDVRAVVVIKGAAYTVSAESVRIAGLQTAFSPNRAFTVSIEKADANAFSGKIQGLGADMVVRAGSDGVFMAEGPVSATMVSWDKWKAAAVTCQIIGDVRAVEFRDIHARAYEAALTGQVRVMLSDQAYTVHVNAEGLDLAQLSDVNPALSAQLSGRVSGMIELAGKAGTLTALAADWEMPDGGKMSASLLGMLTQYIPQSRERKRLDALIRAGGRLPVELLSFALKSDTPKHLSGDIHLASKEVNLEINITNDINTDGTLESLLNYWRTYFK